MLKKVVTVLLASMLILVGLMPSVHAEGISQTISEELPSMIKLGNERLISEFHHLIDGKNVGLITNQSGVNREGVSTIDVLQNYKSTNLVALYGPEHGIDGKAKAGAYVKSFTHPDLGIPVYSLYGATRMPTEDMLRNVDVLIYDIQDIGSRTYTYISTLNYAMVAAQKYNKQIIVLDRPNPVGGEIVDGPMLEAPYISFVGIDLMPMAHGMTVGELAQFFNRNIGVDLIVIPMEGYARSMVWQDTGLPWVQTSPMIPDIDSVFGYMATGLGEGTGIFQGDKFKWIGGKGIDAHLFAALLNQSNLPGVTFIPEQRGQSGGVRLKIDDYHTFNPAKTGVYALAYARSLNQFKVPKSGKSIVMFEKIMGSNKMGQYLEQNLTPQQIERILAVDIERFKEERKPYLLYPSQLPNPEDEVEKVVYLTIDDGPSPLTERILDILKEHEVQATFFVIGKNIKGNEAILKRMVEEGHLIGNHSYSHDYNAIYKNKEAFMKDLEKNGRLIEEVTGVKPTIFRFPGGSNNQVSKNAQDPKLYPSDAWIMPDLVNEITEKGYIHFDWNVSIGDSKSGVSTTEGFLDRIKEGIKEKQEVVLLCHDGTSKGSTVEALPAMIEYLKSEGYTFKVLDENVTPIKLLK